MRLLCLVFRLPSCVQCTFNQPRRFRHKLTSLQNLLVKMPKKPRPADVLRHVKNKNQYGGQFPIPSVIDVQVVGSGGRGTPTSVLITTDHCKYLFNCGEGTQRITAEHRMRLSKLENIFLTHKSWPRMGGLLGMGLTLEATLVPEITIHGPPGVENIIKMAKGISESADIKIAKRELEEGYFEDSAFKIDYVVLHSKNASMETEDEASAELETANSPEAADGSPAPKRRRAEEKDNEGNIAVAYICRAKAAPRKIMLDKCVDLGLKPGPVLGKLKAGESVVLDSGTVITPDQVLSDEEPTTPLLVVDCPEEKFLEALLASPELAAMAEESQTSACLIVHMTPAPVAATTDYQTWLRRFGGHTEHLVLNEWTPELCHMGVYSMQAKLNLLHPHVFPLLPHQLPAPHGTHSLQPRADCEGRGEGEESRDDEGSTDSSKEASNPLASAAFAGIQNFTLGVTGLKYQYRPKKGFTREQCLKLDHEAFVTEAMVQEGVKEMLGSLKQRMEQVSITDDLTYPEVVFLGTGSSVPSKVRNVTAILVHLDESTSLLLDCGEGTAGQLYRHYGNKIDDVLASIKAVFVSHMHADHHLGLFSLLRDRKAVLERRGQGADPVRLLAPYQMSRWLEFYSDHVDDIHSQIMLTDLQSILRQMAQGSERILTPILKDLNLNDFVPVEVEHCKTNNNARRNAFGMALVHSQGWKLVYSGDTMPCDRLVVAGQDCDLLIHEATMEDDLEADAKMKQHSTISQAIEIGQKMRAKFTLLTHFSQRYSKIPVISQGLPDNVGIAFDNMTVRHCDLPVLPLLYEPTKVLFAETYADMELKAQKRTFKKQKLEHNSQNPPSPRTVEQQKAFKGAVKT